MRNRLLLLVAGSAGASYFFLHGPRQSSEAPTKDEIQQAASETTIHSPHIAGGEIAGNLVANHSGEIQTAYGSRPPEDTEFYRQVLGIEGHDNIDQKLISKMKDIAGIELGPDRGNRLNLGTQALVSRGEAIVDHLLGEVSLQQDPYGQGLMQHMLGEVGFGIASDPDTITGSKLTEIRDHIDRVMEFDDVIHVSFERDEYSGVEDLEVETDAMKLAALNNLTAIGDPTALERLYEYSDRLPERMERVYQQRVKQLEFELGLINLDGHLTGYELGEVSQKEVNIRRYELLGYSGEIPPQGVRLTRSEMRYNFLQRYEGEWTPLL